VTTPRKLLVDGASPQFYHIVSRCVRQAFLCGVRGKTDFSHRKHWLLNRLKLLSPAFAVDIYAYAIMSNHFHLVLYFDPLAADSWSSEEVVDRWLSIAGRRRCSQIDQTECRSRMLGDPAEIGRIRQQLGSISYFMKFLKQPIARQANIEDGCAGHFFDKRFYSGALLSKTAVISAMAYVDLNPVRANLTKSLTGYDCVSVTNRLQRRSHGKHLKPIFAGLNKAQVVGISLRRYLAHLNVARRDTMLASAGTLIGRQVQSIRRRQRAFGSSVELLSWLAARGLRVREPPLPA